MGGSSPKRGELQRQCAVYLVVRQVPVAARREAAMARFVGLACTCLELELCGSDCGSRRLLG